MSPFKYNIVRHLFLNVKGGENSPPLNLWTS